MNTNNAYSRIALIGVVCLISLSVQATENKPVVVNNDATNPVPVTIADPVRVSTGGVYRYAGTTIATTSPDIGLNGMNNLCRAEFGDESRMCSSKEFFQTPDTTSAAENPAYSWILPILVSKMYNPITERIEFVEWSGETSSYGATEADRTWESDWTCQQYNSTDFRDAALTVSKFSTPNLTTTRTICRDTLPTTCCTPQ